MPGRVMFQPPVHIVSSFSLDGLCLSTQIEKSIGLTANPSAPEPRRQVNQNDVEKNDKHHNR